MLVVRHSSVGSRIAGSERKLETELDINLSLIVSTQVSLCRLHHVALLAG
jgi:hypothetical protein